MTTLHYQTFQKIPEQQILDSMALLYQSIFTGSDFQAVINDLHKKDGIHIALAWDQNKLVGYKIGYDRKPHHFYSWLGGVDESYRKLGIASELMRLQHEFCQQNGYKTIQTKTKNKWRNMLILNLKHGFDVIGTYTDEHGEPKIILEKKLS